MKNREEPTIFECDICGHNFRKDDIEEFWDDFLWACHNCLEEVPLEIGNYYITEFFEDLELDKEEAIAEDKLYERALGILNELDFGELTLQQKVDLIVKILQE